MIGMFFKEKEMDTYNSCVTLNYAPATCAIKIWQKTLKDEPEIFNKLQPLSKSQTRNCGILSNPEITRYFVG